MVSTPKPLGRSNRLILLVQLQGTVRSFRNEVQHQAHVRRVFIMGDYEDHIPEYLNFVKDIVYSKDPLKDYVTRVPEVQKSIY